MLSAKSESSAEGAAQRLTSACWGRNVSGSHDSVVRHSHAARTGDELVEPRRARLHLDVAGAGDMHIGFLARRDIHAAAAGYMDVGALHAHIVHAHGARAGDAQFQPVNAAVGAGAAAAGDGETQIILVQPAQLDFLAATGQRDLAQGDTADRDVEAAASATPTIAAEADLALADAK